MRRKWLLCGILCGVVSLSVFGQNVGASNYDKQIKETEKQQKEWENKADSLQKEIEEIQADKDDTLKYIEKLDKKTASLEETSCTGYVVWKKVKGNSEGISKGTEGKRKAVYDDEAAHKIYV